MKSFGQETGRCGILGKIWQWQIDSIMRTRAEKILALVSLLYKKLSKTQMAHKFWL